MVFKRDTDDFFYGRLSLCILRMRKGQYTIKNRIINHPKKKLSGGMEFV